MPRERDQIAIAKAVTDLSGLTEHAIATGGIAGEHTLQREGKEQVPLFDAVLMCALEQLAPPRDPAAGPRALAVVHQAEPKPERTSCGPRDDAAPQELLVRTRPDLRALRILANHVRVRPRAAAERVSTSVEVVSRRHLFRANLLDRRA